MQSIDHNPALSRYETDTYPTVLDHRAVPLDLTRDLEACAEYWRGSHRRINSEVENAFEAARKAGWVKDEEVYIRLKTLVLNSLCDSQTVRVERNRKPGLENLVDMNDERVQRAVQGVALPLDLLSILEDHPKLGSIELAKLYHPLDGAATRDMDIDVIAAIHGRDQEILPHKARYKRKSDDLATPAVVALRKQVISEYLADAGRIQVVRRQALLVRGDQEAITLELNPFFSRMVKNPERFVELAQKIEGYYPIEVEWLRPIATTYYAKYIDNKLPEPLVR